MHRLAVVAVSALLIQPACAQQSSQPAVVTGTIARPAPSPQRPTPARQPAAPASAPAVKPASPPPPKIVSFDRTQGPLQVNGQSFTFVEHVQSIDRQPHNPDEDETVEWWELRDSSGKAVYHQQLGVALGDGRFDDTESVDAGQLNTKLGQGILVSGAGLPSAPEDSGWYQVFGLFNGKPIPFGPPHVHRGRVPG